MKIRTILFGYQYKDGQIVVDEIKADIVKEIFSQYLKGQSLNSISDFLNLLHIEYRPGVTGWNKSRIRRIIEEKRYVGNEDYPQIISEDIAQRANEKKEQRNNQKNTDRNSIIYQIKPEVVCPCCHETMKRYNEPRARIHVRGRCQSPDCTTVIGISDQMLLDEIIELMNMLISNPDIINLIEESEAVSLETTRIQNDINRSLDKGQFNKDELRAIILKSASVKYSDLSTRKYEAMRLKDRFNYQNPAKEFPIELFRQTVNRISFDENNKVIITLINGQVIRKESNDG